MSIEDPFKRIRTEFEATEGPKTSHALESDAATVQDHLKYLRQVLASQTDKESIDEIKQEIEKYKRKLTELGSS